MVYLFIFQKRMRVPNDDSCKVMLLECNSIEHALGSIEVVGKLLDCSNAEIDACKVIEVDGKAHARSFKCIVLNRSRIGMLGLE